MNSLRYLKTHKEQTIVLAAVAVITVHLVYASLFALDASLLERFAWSALALMAAGRVALSYGSLDRARRGGVAVAFGLPALLAGVGIHAIHVAQLGFQDSDYTGIPMLVAGAVLSIIGIATLVQLIHTWWRRLLLVPAAPVLLIYGVAPIIFVIAITNVARPAVCCDDTPADRGFAYEDVSFETAYGLTIAGWYVPSQNGAAVITVHGAGSNRVNTMDESMVLAENGYGVLMIDIEGFGESQGQSNSYGWLGARDVHAAVDYLQGRADVDPDRIGGLGLSMGGEIMIQAAGENPDLKAIVAEGATGRSLDDFDEMPGSDYRLMDPFLWMVGATTRVITGVSTPPPLKQMVAQIGPRDALLISADVGEERVLSRMYQQVGGETIQLWEIPEPDHVGAFDNHPDEYEERVIAFFDKALLGSDAVVADR
jgi:pimeloyl-ACP methyl ester carboxylesterase